MDRSNGYAPYNRRHPQRLQEKEAAPGGTRMLIGRGAFPKDGPAPSHDPPRIHPFHPRSLRRPPRLPLRPGRYKLNIAIKDVNGDRKGLWSRSIVVPEFSDDKLSTSTLIVADQMEPVPTKAIGTGSFVIGTTKVRPRVAAADGKPALFKKDKDQKLNFWMQVYNLGLDEKTHKPSATFEYEITNLATNKQVIQKTETTDSMGNIGEQVTLQKSIVAANLQPGTYKINIKVNDNISKQTINPSAVFAVE